MDILRLEEEVLRWNGFVHIPETAPWLAEYLHDMTIFRDGKHDDQVDSTAQFLDWRKKPYRGQGIFEFHRQLAEAAEQRCKPEPVQMTWAPARWNGRPR